MQKIAFAFLVNCFAILNAMAQPGALDLTFNPGTGANSTVLTTSIQSDGKIIIGGYFSSFNGTGRNSIARLNSDGALDSTFNPGTGADDAVYTTSIQSDGKIIIGGWFTSFNGTAINRIARLNSDGSPDSTFNPGTGADNYIRTTSIQSDGKIIIGGGFTSFNGTGRYNIARLNSDGSLDTTFNPGPFVASDVYTISIQSDGKIIIGSRFSFLVRLTSDGSRDSTFNGAVSISSVETTSIQSDGKIIIGGTFTWVNSTARNCLARINSDGSLDTTFNPGTGIGGGGGVSTTSIQSDGKIIIGGAFYSYNGTIRSCIARVNSDGSLDTTFNPGTGTNDWVWTSSMQSDGKIIIGGAFSSYNGTGRKSIARVHGGYAVNVVNQKSATNHFIIYPNPARESVTIELLRRISNPAQQTLRLEIINILGAAVLQTELHNSKTELDISSLNKGIYFVRVSENGNHFSAKLMIQ